ncbi:hypothetical protein JW968_06290 [Candidatus Woesearchaeota archaeon]|nr:hypothetical protein [Candidatus Woesearchaeota archaeon]
MMRRPIPRWYESAYNKGRVSVDYEHLIDALSGALERPGSKDRVKMICNQVGLKDRGIYLLLDHARIHRHLPDMPELRELSLEYTVLDTMRGSCDRRDYFPDLRFWDGSS